MIRKSDSGSGDENLRLGRLGELEFDRLAVKAGLLVSAPLPDLVGKDRIVDFPLERSHLSRDKRPPPRQVVLQIKATKAVRPKAVLELQVAERLAKELRPAALLIVQLDVTDSVASLTAIHITDKILSKILRRLRKSTQLGRSRGTISFDAKDGVVVDPSPAGLYASLVALAGPDMRSYGINKAKQLDTLGFGPDAYQTSIDFTFDTIDELQDGLLGLAPLTASAIRVVERRFDIPLPLSTRVFEGGTKVAVTTSPAGKGNLSLRDMSSGEVAEATFEVFVAPIPLDPADRRYVLRTDVLEFRLHAGRWFVGPRADVSYDTPLPLRSWIEMSALERIMEGTQVRLEAALEGGHAVVYEGSFRVEQGNNTDFAKLSRLLDAAKKIRDAMNLSDTPIALMALVSEARGIETLHDLFTKQEPIIFSVHTKPATEPESGLRAVYFDTTAALGRTCAFAIDIVLGSEIGGDDDSVWKGKGGRCIGIRALGESADDDFRRYREEVETMLSPTISIVVGPKHQGSDTSDFIRHDK